MLLSSERPFVGAFAFCIPGATLLCRNGLTQAVPPESDWNMANGQPRFPRNLGEPCSLLGESRLEIPGYQLQALAAHSSATEQTQRVNPRYRQAKETKRGGMAAGRRSVLIVPLKQGNSPRRTLWRKAKRRSTDSIEGNMPNTSRFTSMST